VSVTRPLLPGREGERQLDLDLGLKPRIRATAPSPDAYQLSFDMALPVALGPEDFYVSEANADAHAMITGGLRWPSGRLVLVGPEGSGKSHLARIWAEAAGAEIVDARDLGGRSLPAPGAALAVEDVQHLAPEAEAALFHVHNHLGETGGRLLLTADRPPARWGLRLPDLASRVEAMTVARLDAPDDALLQALLAKQFADRQLFPAPGVLSLVARRIERSHAAAAAAVAALDRAALSEGRQITTVLARRVLGGDPDAET
jgi:chromosomal replication initiation ATPase DnaA